MPRWSPALVILALSVMGCRSPEPLSASYCVVVSTMEPDAAALNAVMDPFAAAHSLTIDISPTTHSYEDRGGGTLISVDRMGPLGAVISTFRRAGSADTLEEALKRHVEAKVADRWTVRRCQDVAGFKGPWLYE